jgi:hypothetical protein
MREPKNYPYLQQLIQEVMNHRVSDDKPVGRKLCISLLDSVRLAPTVAPTQPQPTSELIAKHKIKRGTSV